MSTENFKNGFCTRTVRAHFMKCQSTFLRDNPVGHGMHPSSVCQLKLPIDASWSLSHSVLLLAYLLINIAFDGAVRRPHSNSVI